VTAASDQEATVPDKVLVFYGSYRETRVGIRMASFVINELRACGALPELVDAREVGLPILDRMYKEYPKGSAPQAMEDLAGKIRAADAFVFVVGEYNWGPQPGLKNLTDHFLEEWFWRPAAIVSYSPSRLSGVRAGSAWHPILSEMGLVVVSSTVAVGPITETLDAQGEPIGEAGRLAQKALRRLADDLAWWTSATRNQRLLKPPPY
jgi:NAD(P)H-dependent FMN reductase